ncbi:MAG TPA: NADH-quinone oxidoreductase subunit C [Sphingobacteriaceae bacterium]|nr:NADH-quinone oxidoreductase subunit C [Sphingobacteriaceae bacterium]
MSEHEATAMPEHLQPVAAALTDGFPELVVEHKADDWLEVKITADQSPEFFRHVKEHPGLAFDYLSDVTAVDYIDQGLFQVVYHLVTIGTNARRRGKLRVKIDVPRDNPRVPSVVDIWPTANFHEREVYDMMGIVFEGHPDLRRILLREDWVGYPLRKDYVDQRPKRTRVTR